MRKQTKIAALVSAAALLAIGASMTSFADWVGPLEDGSYEYHDSYGEAITDEWRTGVSSRDGKTYYYYLNDDGKMAVDQLIEYNGYLYYVNENGERVADYWYKEPNTEGIMVNEIEPANLYYYFNTKGQAVTGKNNVRKSNSDETKSYFQFDSEYHMISGWYGDYYCSGEDEGYVLTGWQYLDKPLDDVWENPYDYDNKAWYYFGTDGAMKKGRQWLEWEGKYSYYLFDTTSGQLLESGWSSVSVASDPDATPSELKAYYIDGGARAKGWVEADYDGSDDDHSTTWFYVESNGVPFNYNGKDASGSVKALTGDNAGKLYTRVAARKIDGKTYLFNEFGEYMTGIYRVESEVACKGSTNPLEKDKIYYFSETSGDPKGSMVTKKVQKTTDDIVDNYCFKSNGQGAENEIVNGVLYGANGKRVDAEDAAWRVVDLSDAEVWGTKVLSDKKDSKGNPVNLAGKCVIVNASGRVKESGTVTIDGVKYYIKSAAAGTKTDDATDEDGKLDEAKSGETYEIVHHYNVD